MCVCVCVCVKSEEASSRTEKPGRQGCSCSDAGECPRPVGACSHALVCRAGAFAPVGLRPILSLA